MLSYFSAPIQEVCVSKWTEETINLIREMYWTLQLKTKHSKHALNTTLKGSFLVYYICVAVSSNGHISVSALTTVLQYCKEVNLRCSALHCGAVDK